MTKLYIYKFRFLGTRNAAVKGWSKANTVQCLLTNKRLHKMAKWKLANSRRAYITRRKISTNQSAGWPRCIRRSAVEWGGRARAEWRQHQGRGNTRITTHIPATPPWRTRRHNHSLKNNPRHLWKKKKSLVRPGRLRNKSWKRCNGRRRFAYRQPSRACGARGAHSLCLGDLSLSAYL